MNRNIIKLATLLVSLLVFFACSGGGSGSKKKPIANTTTGGGALVALTVNSSDFNNGAVIPVDHIMTRGAAGCATTPLGANNESPQLGWTAGPAGTQSYAIVMRDQQNLAFRHWAVWNIPVATRALGDDVNANGVPVGARQMGYQFGGGMFPGYGGPCAPNGSQHTYEFKVYALSIADLGIADANTDLNAIVTAIEANDLAVGSISGTFTGVP